MPIRPEARARCRDGGATPSIAPCAGVEPHADTPIVRAAHPPDHVLPSVHNSTGSRRLPRDTSTRHMPDQTLRASEIRYRRLFEAARDGILILDAVTGEITAVNPFLADLLGYSSHEHSGKEALGAWPVSRHQRRARSRSRSCRARNTSGTTTCRSRPATVERSTSSLSATCTVSDHEQVIQCNIRDITERKRAEKAQQTSDERYAALFEYAPTASSSPIARAATSTPIRACAGCSATRATSSSDCTPRTSSRRQRPRISPGAGADHRDVRIPPGMAVPAQGRIDVLRRRSSRQPCRTATCWR